MALIDLFCDSFSVLCQKKGSALAHDHISSVCQQTDRPADAGLGIAHIGSHIYRTDRAAFLR